MKNSPHKYIYGNNQVTIRKYNNMRSIRRREAGPTFVISCCFILMLYSICTIYLHTRLAISENEHLASKTIYGYLNHRASPTIKIVDVTQQDIDKDTIINNSMSNPWSNPIIHIVTTRFMQGQAQLVHLTRARLELFETICLPSIIGQKIMTQYLSTISNQTENRNTKSSKNTRNNSSFIDPPFIWIIKVDPSLDESSLSKMIELVYPFPNFFLIANDNKHNPIGKWKEDLTKDRLLQGTVYSGDLMLLQRAHYFRNDKISLETRLDADDGLHQMYLKRTQEYALNSLKLRRNSSNENKADWKAWCVW